MWNYIIATTPRSGSNLLCDFLRQNGAGSPEEHLNPSYEGGQFGSAISEGQSTEAYLKLLRQAAPGAFGTKILWEFMPIILACSDASVYEPGALVRHIFDDYKWIFLRRQDRLRQSISLVRAQDTGQWGLRGGEQPAVWRSVPSPKRIHQQLIAICQMDYKWREFFAAAKIEPLTVIYEELISEPRREITRVLNHLGMEVRDELRVRSELRVQADSLTDSVVKEYLTVINEKPHQ